MRHCAILQARETIILPSICAFLDNLITGEQIILLTAVYILCFMTQIQERMKEKTMKTFIVLTLAAFAVFSLSATIRRVDNNSPSAGDYSNIGAAYTAAAAGDTLYIYPSATSYGSLTMAKRLIIIGGGFNPGNSTMLTSKASFTLITGSANSAFIGLECQQLNMDYATAGNNTVRNCLLSSSYNTWNSSGNQATDCWIKGYVNLGASTASNVFVGCFFYQASGSSQNFSVGSAASFACNNCIFQSGWLHFYLNSSDATALITNCIFVNIGAGTHTLSYPNYLYLDGFIFTNCIFESMSNFQSTAQYYYNILENSFGYTGNATNLQNVNMATVMVDVNNGDYHLCAGSVAAGAGQGGVDIGIYGGPAPFDDLYYLNFLPTITDFDCPPITNSTNQLNVHVEAQCGN